MIQISQGVFRLVQLPPWPTRNDDLDWAYFRLFSKAPLNVICGGTLYVPELPSATGDLLPLFCSSFEVFKVNPCPSIGKIGEFKISKGDRSAALNDPIAPDW